MIRYALARIRAWFAAPGVRRTLQHAAAAFLTGFAGTLLTTSIELRGSVDAKAVVALIVAALSAGAVAVFRALFPPSVQNAVTMTDTPQVHIHVDTTALAKTVSKEIAKAATTTAATIAASSAK